MPACSPPPPSLMRSGSGHTPPNLPRLDGRGGRLKKKERKEKIRKKPKARGCQAPSSTCTRAKVRSGVGDGSHPWPGAGHCCDQLSQPAGVLLIGLSRPQW